jgi:hypothetical protein
MPTTHTVNVLHDVTVADGDLTLREAVAQAASGDTIVFSVTGRVELSQGEITIGTEITIDGNVTSPDNGSDVTVDGNDASRVFSVTGSGTLNIDSLNITGGQAGLANGGAVLVAAGGVVTVDHSALTGNAADEGGAIYTAGTATISDSVLSDNDTNTGGGGLANVGTAYLNGSTVATNTANDKAGGIYNDGMLTVTNTTISGNQQFFSDGFPDLPLRGGGGAFNDVNGTMIVTGATISANEGFDGNGSGIKNHGDLSLTNSTISGNGGISPFFTPGEGGGIYNADDANMTLINTTMTGNQGRFGSAVNDNGHSVITNSTITGDSYEFSGQSLTVTNSIFLNSSGTALTIFGIAPTSITNSITSGTAADVFATLDATTGGGVLADNGGPVQTVALKDDPSNPALDIGASALPDARGEALFDFAGVGNDGTNFADAGAYELQCFGPGTLIATPEGEMAVEDLTIGDAVLTADGRAVPVLWIGRQTVKTRHATPRQEPVRIRAGALGQGLPYCDLVVTADHGMLVDGLLINAGSLVNGTTIAFVPLAKLEARVTYYHIEVAAHEVILANGAPTESFVDYAGRHGFDNHDAYIARYGAERLIPEMAVPRVSSRRMLPDGVRARLDKEVVPTRPISA